MPKDKRKKPRPGKQPKRVKNMMRLYRGVSAKKKKKPQFVGRCSGLGLFRFIAQVFEQNERVAREDRLTNEAIELMLLDEFGHNKALVEGFKTGKRTVNYYRDLYNRGRMHNDEPPPVISFRYNSAGLAVDLRNGTKLLETKDRLEYSRKFFGLHSLLKAKTQVTNDEQLPAEPPNPVPQ